MALIHLIQVVPPSDSMWDSIYSSSVYDDKETYEDLTFRLMREI